jgi:hypothetical protein
MRIIVGLLMLVVGVLIVMYTEWLIQNLGTNDWAEAKLGSFGGSRLMYKLLGLVFIFVGFLTAFDMYQGLLMATVGRLIVR